MSKRVSVVATAVLLSTQGFANASQVVTITGQRISSSTALGLYDLGSLLGVGDEGTAEQGETLNLTVAQLRSTSSNDVRCNPMVSDATRRTTSQSMQEERHLAASQLITAINAAQGIAAVSAMLRQNGNAMHEGLLRPVFSIVYADGGVERWAVVSTVPHTLAPEPLPNASPGNGQEKSCGVA